MKPEKFIKDTRIWWDGGEVEFIRWTPKSLIFSWRDATETAVNMPRGVVARLLEKGVLRIEGEVPEWVDNTRSQLRHSTSAPTMRPSVAPIEAKAPPKPQHPSSNPGLFSAITRLIRKIGGEPNPNSTDSAAKKDGVVA
ncbi:MAG: hypothetical protein GYB65_18245 [Chloroflexi bacterium]|nr:hypothetical protein [Chloroflexota bacterium]